MGCCLGVLLLAGAPRLALFVWWLFDPARVTGPFDSWGAIIGGLAIPNWFWALLGFFILPWLTIAYVFVSPGGIVGFDWVILFIALLLDLSAHGGGGREYYRRRAVA